MTDEAPYTFIYEEVIVDGKKVRVFKLGKYGKEKLENAVDRATFNSKIDELNEKIHLLFDVIGRDGIIAYFKNEISKALEGKAKRRHELVKEPYYWERRESLEQLLKEGKAVEVRGGWIKLPQK